MFQSEVQSLPTSKRTGWKRRSLALGRLAGSVTKHCLMKSFCCSSSRDSMHFWMVSAVTWSQIYRKHSDGNKSRKRGCWLPGHPSRRCLSTQVQSFREHTYLGNKQWFQHFHNIRHLGVFFLKLIWTVWESHQMQICRWHQWGTCPKSLGNECHLAISGR